MSCLKMRTCCFCLDTAKGSVFAAVSCIAASIVTTLFLILGFIYWDQFSHEFSKYYLEIGLAQETIEFMLKVVWWGNIITIILIAVYICLCILMIVGVKNEQYKHMIPWISVTSMVLPFFAICFFIQMIMGIIGGGLLAVLVPALVVLLWCVFWFYGFFCAVSHYRVLKGDIHRPVATLYSKP